MSGRPYASLKISQLEELALASREDDVVLRRLAAELRLRKTLRAQKLLRTVEASPAEYGEAAEVGAALDSVLRQEGRVGGPDGNNDSGPSQDYESLKRKYETLRATFTLEAEILARWGMTPLLPADLQIQVFDAWEGRLMGSMDSLIRTPERLLADRERIALERKARGI
ncbi:MULTISPECIES: hypothetical protein [Paenarthrobacter]|uniref:hypothetical protein n=1 Tax=Paenarthrobacter TaxID=1742992 RepID=UPI00074D3CE2|nr:hypothetical protein [Paenarthrobacter ureafaciens]AMB39659.1 hypothetical protein AUT26_05105 [Arthrobacter sp. ATCC 21022]KUR65339.1 hypothetical protein JM67_05705 [Arthrobacter sp. ATCC 21022]